ncbi:helix-turn-helix transcriptional regulator [Spongorhabdus nitratireducens]
MNSFTEQGTAAYLARHYGPIADGITLLFGDHVEVIIHDLASQSIAYISNNISKRKVGDPALLDDVDFDDSERVIGPYQKRNWDGRNICSASVVLRSDDNAPTGMMCINMSTAHVDAAMEALSLLLPASSKLIPQPQKLFHDDWQEKINSYIHYWLGNKNLVLATLNRTDKRQLVEALFNEGAFNGKGAAEYIANVIGIGRATIFNYLRELKNR